MKKIINDKSQIVDDMLSGYIKAHSDRVKFADNNKRIILRKIPKDKKKTALLIGNGSGHEPIAMGWIGEGLLDANVVGDIFAAPSGDLIFEGINKFKDQSGSILLISNHAGDVMNGEMGIELAQEDSINIDYLLMYDDIASAPKGNEDQRRGGAGTTFIYKILGACAEQGASKVSLISLGQTVRDETRTLSVAVASGVSPITGEKIFELADDEIFMGMVVHGELGYVRQKISSSKKIVQIMMDKIFDDYAYNNGNIVIPFINGSGATTLMELLIIYKDVEEYLSKYKINCFKPLVNEYITTQESAGFSISLLRSSEQMRDLWTAPCSAPYFHL
jgi:dihydroxyacetone kinase-like protein